MNDGATETLSPVMPTRLELMLLGCRLPRRCVIRIWQEDFGVGASEGTSKNWVKLVSEAVIFGLKVGMCGNGLTAMAYEDASEQ